MNELTKKCDVLRIDGDESREVRDDVVTESAVQINLNGTELATLLACGYEERELGVGFLRTEGFIDAADEIVDFRREGTSLYFTISEERFDRESKVQKYITSGCGRGVSFALVRKSLKLQSAAAVKEPIVSADGIFALVRDFQGRSETFRSTGGVHSAAICTCDEILLFSEDIGRHNAVDRVIGHALLDGIPTGDKLLLSSGRVSSEIARKVAFAELPILVSRSAPTARALDIAQELGLTVIGFARGRRMNVYTHGQRVGARE